MINASNSIAFIFLCSLLLGCGARPNDFEEAFGKPLPADLTVENEWLRVSPENSFCVYYAKIEAKSDAGFINLCNLLNLQKSASVAAIPSEGPKGLNWWSPPSYSDAMNNSNRVIRVSKNDLVKAILVGKTIYISKRGLRE